MGGGLYQKSKGSLSIFGDVAKFRWVTTIDNSALFHTQHMEMTNIRRRP